jgi:hypothetical protein
VTSSNTFTIQQLQQMGYTIPNWEPVHPRSWCRRKKMMATVRDEPEFAVSRVWRARGLRVSQHEIC